MEKKNYEFAEQFFSFMMEKVPKKSVNVLKDLLSSRSHVNEQTGNYAAATDDLEKCVDIAPDWREVCTRLVD